MMMMHDDGHGDENDEIESLGSDKNCQIWTIVKNMMMKLMIMTI